ncbi:SRPBCC family protein [Streptomyces pseudovenezuelae]|uniref:Phenylpropionate dioxygenase-like ring-hydroxylating dioxygenase large terminal subunit n=1 Tax=Streptomyces pseudovenezuelae TaxID=67350 RepID=A0ABT6LA65_9ACTN|nr:SRPBCC family protein [Streptomyces pseudovenezuelae]MDH6213177.1 phenylpropionate dioxygenase-like ring-hydroxylating dioxygenase large terminal subunit [Streptomyces pseudovenezuelae]
MTHTEIVAELGRYLEADAPEMSLPPAAFTSPELWETERERVFGRSWVLAAHVEELAAPGASVTVSPTGEPLTVVRDTDGALRARSALGPHRPAPAVEEWRGFAFVNRDASAEPLAPHLRRIGVELDAYRLPEMTPLAAWREEWRCNWKIAVQNAHENYHAMGLHPTTVALITPPGGAMEVRAESRWVTRLLSPFREPLAATALPLTAEQRATMYNCAVFPSGSLAAFGDSVVWISMIPLAIDRIEVRGGVLVHPSALEGQDRDALRVQNEESAAVVNREDRLGMEAVQRVVGSRFAERGHLSPKEPGVMAFYRGLARAVLTD